jgi:hypothetical protein
MSEMLQEGENMKNDSSNLNSSSAFVVSAFWSFFAVEWTLTFLRLFSTLFHDDFSFEEKLHKVSL